MKHACKLGAVALLAATTAQAADLTVFDWSGYEDPEFFQDYIAKHGGAPEFAFFADNEEGFNKVMAGFKADTAHPCIGTLPKWRDAGLIEPIDVSRVPAWADMLPEITALDDVQSDGNVWMLPFEWGNTGLVIRTDKVDEASMTYDMLADPSMQGRISIPDGVEDAYGLAALAVGVSDWRNMTMDDVARASDYLRKLHANVRFYWTDPGQLNAAMASGEIDAAWAWNETELALIWEELPAKMLRNDNVSATSWVCGYVNLKDGPGSEDAFYDYLNALSSVQTGKYIIENWGYAHANGKSFAEVDAETLASYGYDNITEFLKTSLFSVSQNPDARAAMIKEFERIKAGF
ncbi:MAG: extracellular solute-binding protein [Paracoccaceae bacterium]